MILNLPSISPFCCISHIISPKEVSSKVVVDFFFQESLYTGYGHSFFTYIFNMIDGFQDLLFHFSKLIITFSKDT